MIELTFKGSSLEEVFENMRQALGESATKAPKAVKEEVQEDETPNQDEKIITLDEIKALTKAKMEEKKTKAIKVLLADFGAERIDGLEEEDYAAFYEKLEEL
ncbi:hypothetical protein JEQ21_03575 [Streptococcus sp. 121]|uniref:hypothetical protein n=1 Tax=Streptococcus sp. 121 TaxID=2797637 RepID=UPI0018F0E2B1|nr:hypothetical protein [Streptococcus sp. 121]MBJ6745553.1 hypothetical protein [Streptococcus sp. 121]